MDGPIVMVEDDVDVIALAKATIDGLQTYTTGDEALTALTSGVRPRLIILDLELPGPNGFDILKAIRESGSNAPVVIFSAKDIDCIEGYALGANAWVTKPATADAMEAALRDIDRFWCGLNQPPS